jgi:hypothetical protein
MTAVYLFLAFRYSHAVSVFFLSSFLSTLYLFSLFVSLFPHVFLLFSLSFYDEPVTGAWQCTRIHIPQRLFAMAGVTFCNLDGSLSLKVTRCVYYLRYFLQRLLKMINHLAVQGHTRFAFK